MRSTIAMILLATAFAGCLSGTGDDPLDPSSIGTDTPADWHLSATYGAGVNPEDIDFQDGSEPHLALHDHGNRSQHIGLSTPNFEILGWDPLESDYHGQQPGGYFCGGTAEDVEGDRTFALVSSFTSEVALTVVDVTDPSAPFKVGELALPNTHIYDADITEDGQYAILATTPLSVLYHGDLYEAVDTVIDTVSGLPPNGQTYTDSIRFTDACGQTYAGPEAELPFASGTLLISLAEPTEPAIADFVPGPLLGPHSVSSTTIDGVRYASSSITNLQYDASYFQFFTVDDFVTGGKLMPYSGYTAQYAQGEVQTFSESELPGGVPSGFGTGNIPVLTNGHVDATVYQHPITGQILAGLSNWDGGMITIDISDPGFPTLLSSWGESTDDSISHSGAIHSVIPVDDLWGDRFLVLAGQEVLGSFNTEPHRPTGQITLIDLTDPEAPEPVARWTLPMELHWSGPETFSTHYFTVVDDILFVAMYHGGVWAVDMAEDQWPELPSLGVFVPDNQPDEPALTKYAFYSPTVLDVFALDDGRLVTFDAESGVYVLEFTKGTSVPVIAPWTQDAWIGA